MYDRHMELRQLILFPNHANKINENNFMMRYLQIKNTHQQQATKLRLLVKQRLLVCTT